MSSAQLGAVVVATLSAAGVTDVVASPGSRNAPLLLALHDADASGRLRLHVRIDERVAGYTALGLAKATGHGVAVVTTSGTATANLAPAAMEARLSGVPLLIVTADRPMETVGTGANQTADQVGVLGPSALAVVRIASGSGAPQAWSAAVQRACAVASGVRTRQPGPVQLNVEFAPPLVGEADAAWVPRVAEVTPSGGGHVAELGPARTVVLVGDATPQAGTEARALAELSGAPLFAEPSSNARCGDNAIAAYRLLLDSPLAADIERVISVGHPTLSRPVTQLLGRDDVELVVVAEHASWHDVGSRACLVADRVLLADQSPDWLGSWTRLDRRLRKQLDDHPETLDGRRLAADVWRATAAGGTLVLGSSQSIRDVDLAPVDATSPTVFANRGAAGIDGVVATATGIALGLEVPVTVLLGDLTLQHDLGALVAPPLERAVDLRVVVAHDDGGAIFATLEQGADEYADAFERVFGTPQGLDAAAVARALGWRVTTPATPADLARVLAEPVRGRELIVVRLDRSGRRAESQRLRDLGRAAE